MRQSIKVLSGLVAICGLLVTTAAKARPINVDMDPLTGSLHSGTYTGTGADSDSGTFWNSYVPPSTSLSGFLNDSAGTATTVQFTLSGTPGPYDTKNDGPSRIAAFAPALLDDYAFNNPTFGFTISGLIAGQAYDLYLYSQNGGYNSQVTTFTVGSLKTVTNTGADLSGFVLNGNYVLFTGVVATGGSISGTVGGAGGALNGFQITLPEPASLGLLATGGLLLMRRMRRSV